jgi:outer membrane protein OmpA-like peptidoglycan-associated protein
VPLDTGFQELTMITTMYRHGGVAAAAVLALLCIQPAHSQQQGGPVLNAKQVTEDALVDALAIDAPATENAGGTTRGFRPASRPTGEAQKPAGPGKANLLITFATGSAELTPESMQVLDTVAKAMRSDRLAGFAFNVEGHADRRGTNDYNMKLSEERAQSVVAYLTGKLGVLPDRLVAVGKGATEPLNPDKPDAQENRRVTIVTTH